MIFSFYINIANTQTVFLNKRPSRPFPLIHSDRYLLNNELSANNNTNNIE